jgi:uncharacterized protein with HEPN domain
MNKENPIFEKLRELKPMSRKEYSETLKLLERLPRTYLKISELRIQNPEILWDEMYYLRNRVAHEYFGNDYEII